MSILSQNSSNWILSFKVVLMSTGVLCTAMVLKLSVPFVMEFAFSEIPSIWSFVTSWLRPPYLYLVINCIIISIVASSKLQQKFVVESPLATEVQPAADKISADYAVVHDGIVEKSASVEDPPEFVYGHNADIVNGSNFDAYEHVDSVFPELEIKETTSVITTEDMSSENEWAMSRSVWRPKTNSMEYSFVSYEKPPVSVRIGHRKAIKPSAEGGKILRVSKPRRNETLESTWKTITEGRAMPLTRHLRKSDTWEIHGRASHIQEHDQRMAKSETFNDRTTVAATPTPAKLRRGPSGSGKLRKEPSLGQDELNRRVEAFIKKFNEEMRLQRQESLNQYMEMINRGAH